jgi:hypothetical protein
MAARDPPPLRQTATSPGFDAAMKLVTATGCEALTSINSAEKDPEIPDAVATVHLLFTLGA